MKKLTKQKLNCHKRVKKNHKQKTIQKIKSHKQKTMHESLLRKMSIVKRNTH